MNKSENILVSVICNTYNHEPYIRQCLEGFVMQKTTFTFEVLIHDDASTDKTADIIREYEAKYPELIKPIYQTENQYSKKTGIMKTFQYPRVKGKYIAFCEGDDYWIDSLKLQKQVDFLEINSDYGLVHTHAKVYVEKTQKFKNHMYGMEVKSLDALLIENRIMTNTVCFRKEFLDEYQNQNIYNSSWKMGDYPLWLWIMGKSKIYLIEHPTAVYRILQDSASHSNNIERQIDFHYSAIEISIFFCKKYNKKGLINKVRQINLHKVIREYILCDKRFVFFPLWIYFSKPPIDFRMIILNVVSKFAYTRRLMKKRWGNM